MPCQLRPTILATGRSPRKCDSSSGSVDRKLLYAVGQRRGRGPILRRIELAAGPIDGNAVRVEPLEVIEQEARSLAAMGRDKSIKIAVQHDEIDPLFDRRVEHLLRGR